MGEFSLVKFLRDQREWSFGTFGAEPRAEGIVEHIRKELQEILADPSDLEEWIDVVLLALDGAWRAGHSPEAIVLALESKLAKNKARKWPDITTVRADQAVEHTEEAPAGTFAVLDKCVGMNCGRTDGMHSKECEAEAYAAYAGGWFLTDEEYKKLKRCEAVFNAVKAVHMLLKEE